MPQLDGFTSFKSYCFYVSRRCSVGYKTDRRLQAPDVFVLPKCYNVAYSAKPIDWLYLRPPFSIVYHIFGFTRNYQDLYLIVQPIYYLAIFGMNF